MDRNTVKKVKPKEREIEMIHHQEKRLFSPTYQSNDDSNR